MYIEMSGNVHIRSNKDLLVELSENAEQRKANILGIN